MNSLDDKYRRWITETDYLAYLLPLVGTNPDLDVFNAASQTIIYDNISET